MRIIGGILKNKKILLPEDKKTRPLKDIVKESIFNLIEHSKKINFNINNAHVLDLFSGIGSFGIECISRGAGNVDFVENYSLAQNILKKNISNLKIENKCNIIDKDCFNFLSDNNKKFNTKYDMIFLDPPYKEKDIDQIIGLIRNTKILKNKGLIIIHRHKKDDIKDLAKLKILDIRNYGISKIVFGI
tara:strand:- start:339 stop:902 length:564 start_codon:yes stop_codon:yes gene_type:complete